MGGGLSGINAREASRKSYGHTRIYAEIWLGLSALRGRGKSDEASSGYTFI